MLPMAVAESIIGTDANALIEEQLNQMMEEKVQIQMELSQLGNEKIELQQAVEEQQEIIMNKNDEIAEL